MKTTNHSTHFNQRPKLPRLAVSAALMLAPFFSAIPIAAQDNARAARPSAAVSSSVPRLIRFAGVAKDADNQAMSGTLGVTFSLYKEQRGGAPLWMETQNVRADSSGHYSVQLGATKPDGLQTEVFTSVEARWLGVEISGQAEQPRVLLLSVPYALKAGDAETIGGLPPSAFVQAAAGAGSGEAASANGASANSTSPPLTGAGKANYITRWTSHTALGDSVMFQSSAGKVGVGTTTPEALLDVKATNLQTLIGDAGCGANFAGIGFVATGGFTNCTNYALLGDDHGFTYINSSLNGSINFRNNNSVELMTIGASGNVGIGTLSPSALLDVKATNLQTLIGDAGCGANFAGVGFVVSGGFAGCSNYALLGDNFGNTYVNSSSNGSIHFRNNNGFTPDLMSIDTHGNVNIKGSLSKGSGSFKIDHPLDPANKYLYHSFVESPDMMNVYNGNVVTDKHGVATVVLPDYFEALNREFRYQLTPIGQFAQAFVAQEISRNHFTIKTSKPGVKVSWQVTGVRHDAYAEANRIQVEVEKPREEQGRYLHPELFGAAPEQGVGYVAPSSLHPAGELSGSLAVNGNN
jgi:hypothetical protein